MRSSATPITRRRLLVAGGAALLAACAPRGRDAAPGRPESSLAAHPATDVWPAFYRSTAPEVREAYAYAVGHRETLRFIPCYCGCGRTGHADNYACYVRETRPGGWAVLDTHGYG